MFAVPESGDEYMGYVGVHSMFYLLLYVLKIVHLKRAQVFDPPPSESSLP